MMASSIMAARQTDRSHACEAWDRPLVAEAGQGPGRLNTTVVRDYSLYDESGRRLGTISAAERQPTVGSNAPTFFLRRSLTP